MIRRACHFLCRKYFHHEQFQTTSQMLVKTVLERDVCIWFSEAHLHGFQHTTAFV